VKPGGRSVGVDGGARVVRAGWTHRLPHRPAACAAVRHPQPYTLHPLTLFP